MEEGKGKLLMFDGNAILHRAYHAYPATLVNSSGMQVNAIYGFAATLLHSFKKMKPSHVIVCFDEKKKTFRHEKFEEYKAKRPKMDQELVDQIIKTREVVKAFNIPIYTKEGYEADDLLGTISRMADKDFEEIVIVTGDKDILQLITKKTHIYFPSRGRIPEKYFNEESFKKEYGFLPKQLIDYKGLAGDASDNIPGVMGVGSKTASKLVQEFQSVENIYKNINRLKGSLKEKLEKDKTRALLSKDLATIETKVPVVFQKEKARLCEYDKEGVVKLFEEMEFRSLIRRLPSDKWEEEAEGILSDKKEKEKNDNQMSLF